MKKHHEVIYSRDCKKERGEDGTLGTKTKLRKGVLYVIQAHEAIHGFDGKLGICDGHPLTIPQKTPADAPVAGTKPEKYTDFFHYCSIQYKLNPSKTMDLLMQEWQVLEEVDKANNRDLPSAITEVSVSKSDNVSTLTHVTGIMTDSTPGDSTAVAALAALGSPACGSPLGTEDPKHSPVKEGTNLAADLHQEVLVVDNLLGSPNLCGSPKLDKLSPLRVQAPKRGKDFSQMKKARKSAGSKKRKDHTGQKDGRRAPKKRCDGKRRADTENDGQLAKRPKKVDDPPSTPKKTAAPAERIPEQKSVPKNVASPRKEKGEEVVGQVMIKVRGKMVSFDQVKSAGKVITVARKGFPLGDLPPNVRSKDPERGSCYCFGCDHGDLEGMVPFGSNYFGPAYEKYNNYPRFCSGANCNKDLSKSGQVGVRGCRNSCNFEKHPCKLVYCMECWLAAQEEKLKGLSPGKRRLATRRSRACKAPPK